MNEVTIDNIKQLLTAQTAELKINIKEELRDVNRRSRRNHEKIQKLEETCIQLKRREKKNNIIIFGITPDESNLNEQVLSRLNFLLDLSLSITDINNIYKIGSGSKPPIIVEFISYIKKTEIFANKEKLRALKGTNISISYDLCEEDRRDQKILRKHLKEARQKNIQARIKGNKIEIDNKWYSVKDLQIEESDSEYESYNETEDDSQEESEPDVQLKLQQKNPKSNKLHDRPAHSSQKHEGSQNNIATSSRHITDNQTTKTEKRKKLTPSPTTRKTRKKRI